MKDLHSSVRELAVLHDATEMILSSVDVDTVLHHMLLIVRSYFGITRCAVLLVDADGRHLSWRAQNGYPESQVRGQRLTIGEQGVTGWAAHTRAPVYVPDVAREPRYIAADPSIRSELALPLVVRDQVIGVLNIESESAEYFTEPMIELLGIFAGQAAVALENARLYSTERRRMRQIELINLIARAATASGEIEPFLATVADLVADTFEGSEVAALLRKPDGSLSLVAHSGVQSPVAERFAACEQSGIVARALAARMNAVQNEAAAPDWPACYENTGSELCAPLLSFGEIQGALVVAHREPNFFTADDRAIAQAAADVCATAMKNVQLAEELRRVANTDSLTGVSNQRHFHSIVAQELSRAQRYKKPFAVVLLDLRNFRRVNAALGFDAGDEVLRQAASALRYHTRRMDTVCRYAGDRFAIVLPETDAERVGAVLEKINQDLHRVQVTIDGAPFPMTAAMAHVNFPQDGGSEIELMRVLLSRLAEARKNVSAAGA